MTSGGAGPDYRALQLHLDPAAASRRPIPSIGDAPLKFSTGGNAKLPAWVASFSLPSGHTCPGALECKSRRSLTTGKIEDGKHCKYRCFSASMEAVFENTWQQRLHNWKLLRMMDCSEDMANMLCHSLPAGYAYMRLHVGGDFFNQTYFDAWLEVARRNSHILFYGYTKSLVYWARRISEIPDNLVLTASRGGRHDELISQYGFREAVVVLHPREAVRQGLEIDHDDSHAMRKGPSFALLLHGVQPKGSEAAQALKTLKTEKITYGYARPTRKPPNG